MTNSAKEATLAGSPERPAVRLERDLSDPPEVVWAALTDRDQLREFPCDVVVAGTWGEETLRFELTPTGGGTRLALINELEPGGAARNAAGWEGCLDRLAGIDSAEDAWRPRFERYAAEFEPTLGAQEGPPAGDED